MKASHRLVLFVAAALLPTLAKAVSCAGVAAWDPATVYAKPGNSVAWAGHLYQNKWWTLGEDPTRSGPWDVWADRGACDAVASPEPVTATTGKDDPCRPEGMAVSAVPNVPYCLAYAPGGAEKLANGLKRRNIGYFTSWRTGADGRQRYLAGDIPWAHLTHVNYAFAHVDAGNRISVNADSPSSEATGLEWPGVAGAEMDPAYPWRGHFNLLAKHRKGHPDVKLLVSVGGWSESGGYITADGTRIASGGFYAMTTTAAGAVNASGIAAFADSVVAFLRQYGFDGVDIDYEYPTSMAKAGNPLDWPVAAPRLAGLQAGYRELLRVLRERLDGASVKDGRYYLLTAAVPASSWLLRGMESGQALRYLDFVNVMSYDLHGTWNEFVGPHAPLFDDGRDPELARWNVYLDPQYKGIGSLNTDWAWHYYRGAMPPGRINIGVPYYTRGWRGVAGGENGLWGSAPASDCPAGVAPPCGSGAEGIDNLWHDLDEDGRPLASGTNPLWHARNLERGVAGDYLPRFGLGASDLQGAYGSHYDETLVAPWLWNAQKGVFLSTEDERSLQAKADWVVRNGLGGVMHWELAGDFDWDATRTPLNGGGGQFVPGSALTRLLAAAFRSATPYATALSASVMPAETLDVAVELAGFALGDASYPIAPALRVTNNTGAAIPRGAVLRFQYPTSAPDNWVAAGMTVTSGHVGANAGGLKGDFHTVDWVLPAIAAGATREVRVSYRLPISGPSNFRLLVNGKSFALRQEYPLRPLGRF